MTRSGTPNQSSIAIGADPRIPFPFTDKQTACQKRPEWFSHEQTRTVEKDIAQAKRACAGCPIVNDCLKWALAYPDLAKVGVWAATTPRQRQQLRRRLESRLGPDWVGVVAQRDQAARQQRAHSSRPPKNTGQAEHSRAQTLAHLELELIPTRPAPYEPWREPMTPERQVHNWRVLGLALTQRI